MKEVFTRSLRFQTMELGWLGRGILIEFERIKDAEGEPVGEPVEPVEPVAKRRKLIEGDTEWSLSLGLDALFIHCHWVNFVVEESFTEEINASLQDRSRKI
jgi:hypothetical protein